MDDIKSRERWNKSVEESAQEMLSFYQDIWKRLCERDPQFKLEDNPPDCIEAHIANNKKGVNDFRAREYKVLPTAEVNALRLRRYGYLLGIPLAMFVVYRSAQYYFSKDIINELDSDEIFDSQLKSLDVTLKLTGCAFLGCMLPVLYKSLSRRFL
jgi:hypothetical protein